MTALTLNSGRYQFMPDLAPELFAALKADIARRGIVTPVDVDEEGNILDGHNRYRAWRELQKNEPPPTIVRAGLSEGEKRAFARRQNLLRRHLSREEMRSIIGAQLQETPELSDRAIAKDLGVDHKTVGATRRRLSGEIPHPRNSAPAPDFAHEFTKAMLGSAKAIRENRERVAGLPDDVKLAMFDAGISGARTIFLYGNPFGHSPLTVEQGRAWGDFACFLQVEWGWTAEAAGEHVSWLVDHKDFRTPDEWLGEEGAQYRARQGMREPSPEFAARWRDYARRWRGDERARPGRAGPERRRMDLAAGPA
jgi:hypothetical protein